MISFSKNQKITIVGIVVTVLLTVGGWIFVSGTKYAPQNLKDSPGAVQIQGNGNIVNANQFPAPSFNYSVSFLNSTSTGLPLTPEGSPYKSSFNFVITHAPATQITGSIEWKNNIFSSCTLYSGWAQEVDNTGMLESFGNFVCFSTKAITDPGNLFSYNP
ncbi:MAG: hypothetical protein KGJ34_00430 [Patescibacteria group bacterium]|nr:hypothetical protein [Patescibacteria group bacterium]